MRRLLQCAVAVVLLYSPAVFATTFVVPEDAELIHRAEMIVTGRIAAASVVTEGDEVVTLYEVRTDRMHKGGGPRETLVVGSPGGVTDRGGVLVEGAAHFETGDRVLLMLERDGSRWRTVHMTLGKFRYAVSQAGESLLVRDWEQIIGWDRDGRIHRERARSQDRFLRFIEETASGANPSVDYFMTTNESMVTTEPPTGPVLESAAVAYAPNTYTDNVSDGSTYRGIRWPSISSGVTFYKRADTNISGAADGGAGAIQSGLNAWTSECGSNINLIYGGTTPTASKNFDSTRVVEFNDPQGRVGGSWGGSGTIAITFLSFSGTHSFAGQTWWNISDADVVFQDGFPATHGAFATAMTHELGHGIGWRHSNQHYIGGTACDPAVEECTSAAIMNSSAVGSYGYTLQPWDINAARAVYPGGTCTNVSLPGVAVGVNARATGANSVTVTWTGVSGATSYDIYRRGPNGTSTKIANVTGTSFVDNTVAANTAYLYHVVSVNTAGVSAASAADLATTVVFTDSPLSPGMVIKAVHLAELRTAVNAVRALAGLTPATFTDAAVRGVTVKAVHINELRTALDQARGALGLPTGGWTDTIARGVVIRARHFEEIRERVR